MAPSISFCVLALLLLSLTVASSFTVNVGPQRTPTLMREGTGNIEQIEFKIYPDGRVEETVRGIKGGNCHKVTEKINESLGKVVESAPTEEMYEQELTIDQTETLTQTDGGSSWEGSSSW